MQFPPGLNSLLRRTYPIGVFMVGLLLAMLTGMRMRIPFDYFQLQAEEWLLNDLWRSIYYLHSQPPLPNLWLGLGLKIAWVLKWPPSRILLMFHIFLGILGSGIIGAFAHRFLHSRRLAVACTVLLLMHPMLYASLHQYFYTFHEWVLMAGLALAVHSHAEAPGWKSLSAVAVIVTMMVYTRSLFHPLWAIAILVLCAGWGIRGVGIQAKQARIAIFAASCFVMLLWPMKNLAVFGVFGYSSWLGANFSQDIAMKDFPIPVDGEIPPNLQSVPCLNVKLKILETYGDESLVAFNYNHYTIIETSRKLMDLSKEMIRNDPGLFKRKFVRNYWAFTRFTGRQPHYADFGVGEKLGSVAKAWMKLYEVILNQDFRSETNLMLVQYRPKREGFEIDHWLPSLMWLTLPLILLAAFIRALCIRRSRPADAFTAFILIFNILWVLAMVLLVDGREGNRMRFSTEAYMVWLGFWLADGILNRKR